MRILVVALVVLFGNLTVIAQDSTNAFSIGPTLFTEKPFFEVYGGLADWKLDNSAPIENGTLIGVNLGFESTKPVRESSVFHTQSNGLYLNYVLPGEESPTSYTVEAFRFGFTNSDAYGYSFSEGSTAGLYLGVQKAPLSWYSLTISDNSELPGAGQMARFEDALRFGEAATAQVDVRVVDAVSISAGYEWALVYERHMFWDWALSSLIEGVTDGAAAYFISEIGERSPIALPIMHFIIRNGIAMGFKALRMNQMNWPSSGAAPLNSQTFTLGVNVAF